MKTTKVNQFMLNKLVMHKDYPKAIDGNLGFKQLQDSRPDSMKVNCTYVY